MSLNYEVGAEGPIDARVVLIGEAPAEKEFTIGKPFQGSAGSFLNNLLSGAGLQRGTIRITNLSKERAPGNKMERMPFDRLKMWEQDLLEEINLLSCPKILVPLGNYALKAVTGRTGITNLRGSVLPPVKEISHDCIVIPTIHPSKIHYDYSVWPLIGADLAKVKIISDQDEPFQFPTYRFKIQPSFDEVMDFFDWLDDYEEMVVIDIENPHLLLSCIGIAWSRSDAFCIPFYWGDGRNYWTEEQEFVIWKRLSKILPKLNWANQNVFFDWEVMLNHKILLKAPVYDSMLMHSCLYSELRHKLEIITSIYTNIEYYKKDEKEEKGSVIKVGDETGHWKYNCLDCISTFWAIEELKKELIEENLLDFYHSFYSELMNPFFKMNINGVRLNMKDIEKSRSEMADILSDLTISIERAVGHPLNVNSPKQVASVLYDEFCMSVPKIRGDSERPTSKDALTKLAYQYKIDTPLKIIEARSHLKLMSLFSDDNIENGRLRCQYSLAGTTTGRLASRKKKGGLGGKGMNLQNVKTVGPARSFFIAEDGHVLLGADQSQAEARVVGWLSKDQKFMALFESGKSIHIQNAYNLYGEWITKEDPRYKIAKSLIHGSNYGLGPWVFAYMSGLSFREAKEKQQLYFSTYPGIRGFFHKYVETEIRERGMLYNPFGRRQVFFGRMEDTTFRAGYAFIPQSTVSDINKIALKRVEKHYMALLELHDGLVLSVPANDIKGGYEALNEAYKVTFEIWGEEHSIPIEISIGDNWRDMEQIDESYFVEKSANSN
jgi:uracil-DNA glycosylase family 4